MPISAAYATVYRGARVHYKPRRGTSYNDPDVRGQGKPRASEFVFARLRYDSGDWDYNPKVAANILNSVVEYTNIRVFPRRWSSPPRPRSCWRSRFCS